MLLDQVPSTQFSHVFDVDPILVDHVPRPQAMHDADDVIPTTLDHVPATQFVHAEFLPEVEDQVPAEQSRQIVAPDTDDQVPTEQSMQLAVLEPPVTEEYFPGEQF